MFDDKSFTKLFHTKGIRFTTLKYFIADKRLASPFSIIEDGGMTFGEYESYPLELAEVAYNNGF